MNQQKLQSNLEEERDALLRSMMQQLAPGVVEMAASLASRAETTSSVTYTRSTTGTVNANSSRNPE